MSVAVVLGPRFADLADFEATGADSRLRVRGVDETVAVRADALRTMFTGGTDALLLVDHAIPVSGDWAKDGALFALVADHLNLTGDNPLVGANAEAWGPRFPDMTAAWDPELRETLREAARRDETELRDGVLAGVASGAMTAAELDMLRLLGADMASEGFVAEAIVARHAGVRVAGIAVLDAGLPGEADALRTLLGRAVPALAAAGRGA